MKLVRILGVLLALTLLFTACSEPPRETQPEAAPSVGLCLLQGLEETAGEYRQLLEAALTEKGYAVSVTEVKNDAAAQNAQIEELIESGCDLLIIEPVAASQAEDIAQRLRQADVPGVIVGREPAEAVLESWDKVCFVGSDGTQPGLMQSQIVLEQPDRGDINDDGVVTYLVLEGPLEDPAALLRTEYCAKGLTFAGIGTRLLAQNVGEWTRDSGRALCERALATYGVDIEVIFCNNDAIALGAMEAIEDSGWTVGQDLYLVGVDGEAEALKMAAQGRLTGTVLRDIPGQVDAVLRAVQRLLQGEPVESRYYVDYVKVTAQNAESFLP